MPQTTPKQPTLYIVPTPIGNLDDITLRALKVLQQADIVLAEDTRTTSVLLKHHQIVAQKLQAYHMHNEHLLTAKIVQTIENQNLHVALVTDAGTPGISDPAFLIVRACTQNPQIRIEVLPGATAFVPALVASGLPCDKFCFEGFLPPQKGRKTRLTQLAAETRTIALYESPMRILKTLTDLEQYFGATRKVSLAREITKLHEEHLRGTIAEVKQRLQAKTSIKGEMVLIIEGNPN